MARILIADDDVALLDVLALAFSDAGHDVTTAPDGKAASTKVLSGEFDLLVTDIQMPHLDGFALVRDLRKRGVGLPILILTSRDSEVDEVLGFELGADDFVSKPFSTRALLARVSALLKRQRARDEAEPATGVVAGKLALDPERLEAAYDGKPFTLTMTEFRLLEALARRPGIVLSRDRLLELGRDDDSIVDARLVDTYVRRLRRKIEAVAPDFDAIETVIGAGYRLRA